MINSWLKAYPELAAIAPLALLLTLACVVAVVDLFVRDPQRRLSLPSLGLVGTGKAFATGAV